MNVPELLAALDANFSELREIAEGMGMATWEMPSDLAAARAQVASTAEWRFGDRALHEIVERAFPSTTLRRLLRRQWSGQRADYNLRPGCQPDLRDRGVRRLAAQLSAAWNSPDIIDERMNAGLARQLFRPMGELDEMQPSRRPPFDEPLPIEEHAPDWWNDTYFQVSPGSDPPAGLTRTERALFEHQRESVQKLTRWWNQHEKNAGVLCLPTGGGKTRTAVNFVLSEVIKKDKVIWLTHRDELMQQAIGTFLESAGDAAQPFTLGRFAKGSKKVQAPVDVLVASIPSLARKRDERLHCLDQVLRQQRGFGLIVVDECHHGVARTWKRLIRELQERCPNIKLLGLSATPTRSAEKEQPAFWGLFDSIVHEVELLDLIQRRVLARPKVEVINTGFEFSATPREKAGFEQFNDLPVSLVKRICEDEGRNNRVISTFVDQKSEWGSTLVFAATVEQGRYITRRMKELGVTAGEVYGDTPELKRKLVLQAFRKKKLQAIVNVGLFTEGTDIPGVETVFLARPTRSKILFRQMVGRGLRGPKIGGSEECTVVAFFDEVNGLIKENLASSFQDEREAVVALGLGDVVKAEPPQAEEPTEDEMPEQVEGDDLVGIEAELRQLLRQQVPADAGSVTSSLLGWWEAVRGGRRAFIPVFDDVADAINGFVNVLPSKVDTMTVAEELLLPESVLTRFLSIAHRPGVERRYVDLEEATPEEARAMFDEVAAARRTESDPTELGWLEAKSDDASEERFAVLVDGHFEPVEPNSFWRLQKEWEHYSIDFGIKDRPDLAPSLAQLLLAKAAKTGVTEVDAMAILDAAADNQEFPSVRRATRKADVPGLLKALEQTEASQWDAVVEKAWGNGLSEAFDSRSDLLVAAMVHLAKAS
jgi:superfamily II DNA or RNA helicase